MQEIADFYQYPKQQKVIEDSSLATTNSNVSASYYWVQQYLMEPPSLRESKTPSE